MANISSLLLLFPFFLLVLIILCPDASGGRMGGRNPVRNVESNKEVQELGRYCVQEYNRKVQQKGNGTSKLLTFSQVVEAETQVVSGIKYYLKISAAGFGNKTYDAVVWVKPWLHTKELLDFTPSTPLTNTNCKIITRDVDGENKTVLLKWSSRTCL